VLVSNSPKDAPCAPAIHLTIIRGMKIRYLLAAATLFTFFHRAGDAQAPSDSAAVTVLRPARIFDGETTHEGWAVRVKGDRIDAAAPSAEIAPGGARVIDLPGTTLVPGLVEGHSHVLLHAYNETTWNDQVAHEGLALRV